MDKWRSKMCKETGEKRVKKQTTFFMWFVFVSLFIQVFHPYSHRTEFHLARDDS